MPLFCLTSHSESESIDMLMIKDNIEKKNDLYDGNKNGRSALCRGLR